MTLVEKIALWVLALVITVAVAAAGGALDRHYDPSWGNHFWIFLSGWWGSLVVTKVRDATR